MANPLSRDRIITTLVATLSRLDYVNAAWEGGAAAFDRVDEWSDIDLIIDVQDERADEAWGPIEQAIRTLGTIELCYPIPHPPLGLHAQRFYRLREAGPFLLLDLGLFKASTPDKLLDPATHGHAVVHFDRTGATRTPGVDAASRQAGLMARVDSLRVTFPLFQSLVTKELNRGNDIEALAFYHAWTLRPLVELLRIRHCPARYLFHTRYVQHDLPSAVVGRLSPMFFVRDAQDIAACRGEAERWVNALLEELLPPAARASPKR
jgi:hypothetical protein